jgi:hypothetical protein
MQVGRVLGDWTGIVSVVVLEPRCPGACTALLCADGTSSEKVFRDQKPMDGKDMEFDFPVPFGLRSVNFKLTAQVKIVASGDMQSLADMTTVSLNGIDATQSFVDAHLQQTAAG